MSRIGKSPIAIPAGVTVEVKDAVVTVKGKLGELSQAFSDVSVTCSVMSSKGAMASNSKSSELSCAFKR